MTESSPKLSLCMIVKDEEQSLAACLDTVKDIVDEMVILDTGSSDKTPDIAQEYGAKLHHFQWCNDFAAARNEALKYVTGDWVLVLDADERLHPSAKNFIRVAMVEENLLVLNLVRKEVGASQSPYSLTSRLFRNHPKIQFSRPYHALVDDSVVQLLEKEPQWRIRTLPNVAIVHFGYSPHSIAAKDKHERAKAAMESYIAEHPEDAYVCSKLGALYLDEGKKDEAIKLLQKGLKDPNSDPLVTYELNYHLGNAYTRKNKTNQAIVHYQAALSQNVLEALKLGAYNNLGSLLFAAGENTMAQRCFAATVKADPTFAPGYYNLGMVFRAESNFKEAIPAYEKAIKLKPDYAQAYQNLGVAWLKCGKMNLGLEYLGKAVALLETQNLLEAQRLRQELKEMGFDPPQYRVEAVLESPISKPQEEAANG
ncbi:tetratricopeptide repeat protein [Spirulina sp. CS-785/01]|uniref:glycosyltransferase n=1 Tax=Spirulina sp. CS-785/01 TaxID=3021716 RepID=UPI00232BCE4B|nr:TPR domain-containing glycosyltransferase [Spirulina sp. CS-785/01]MDB9314431.1 tetratricopeptide repeat protein [Spirulina sp. CS-785/01]